MKTTDDPIVVEQLFDSSIEAVWEAITNPASMRRWYFAAIPSFRPEVGFKTRFNVDSSDRSFMHVWEVTEVQIPRLISYTWEFEHYSGKSSTRFELTGQNGSTKLKLTVDVLEDFEDHIPEFTRESCLGGWRYFINGRLNEFLAPNPV